MEGRKGLQHHWKPYELFQWSPEIVLRSFCGVWSHGCPCKLATKEGRRWSQCYLPKQSKKADFCWARCCWPAMYAYGGQKALMTALHRSGRPYTIAVGSNLLLDEGSIHVRGRSGLHKLQPVPVCCV